MRRMNIKIAALAFALTALASAPSSAAVVPAGAQAPGTQAGIVLKTAAPGVAAPAGQKLESSAVEQVQRRYYGRGYGGYYGRGYYGRGYYGGGYYGRRYYGGGGRWVAPAIIGGLIIGGTIAQSQAGYRDRWEMCAERYQSFSWSDGTFQPYDGPRRPCPYLY